MQSIIVQLANMNQILEQLQSRKCWFSVTVAGRIMDDGILADVEAPLIASVQERIATLRSQLEEMGVKTDR